MFNQQAAYQQGQGQYIKQEHQGGNYGANGGGPPPLKKAKTIITKYPPPPGYAGLGAPTPAYQQQQWQQPGQLHAYGQTPYPGYAPPGYGQSPQGYNQPHQPYAQHHPAYSQPHQAYPQHPQAYPPPQHGYPQQPQTFVQPHQQYKQPQYAGHPVSQFPQHSHYPNPASAQAGHAMGPPPPSFAQNGTAQHTRPFGRRRFSSAAIKPDPTYIKPDPDSKEGLNGNQDWVSLQDQSIEEVDDLNTAYLMEEYDRGSSYTTHAQAEDIDPNLSLGYLTWYPALPTKRPLPATFNDAEVEAIAPRRPLATDDEAISDHFICSRRHEALLSVRQTEGWDELKNDINFRDFPSTNGTILSKSEILDKYKDRHNADWEEREPTPTPEPEDYESDTGRNGASTADEVNGYGDSNGTSSREGESDPADMLGDLEKALNQPGLPKHPGQHARMTSNDSSNVRNSTHPRALLPVRDAAQDDILAALGVTGSPKIVYETPGPAIGPPPPQRERSLSRPARQASTPGVYDRRRPPPPPPGPPPGPPPQRRRSSWNDPWAERGNNPSFGRRSSNSSQHTAAGSDFNEEDPDKKTPRANTNTLQGRKRSHEESRGSSLSGIMERDEDTTPKPRRKHPRVDEVYNRRW